MGVKGRSCVRMYPNLKLRLWTTGIRHNRLAKMLAMDETALSRIVNGFRQPTPEVRERIAAVLESEESWLFETVEANSGRPLTSGDQEQPAPARRNGRRNRASAAL